jgi:hypothetical protein
MDKASQKKENKIPALKVHQWLEEWEKVTFDPNARRKKPLPYFFMFTLSASRLKTLSGIYRRTIQNGQLRHLDLGIQRRHEPERSREIAEFVQHGFPWSDLSAFKRSSGQYDELKKPGWLPTAIVVNILKKDDIRSGKTVSLDDMINIEDNNDSTATINLPANFHGPEWKPKSIHPIEVIDGQHRLWAFEDASLDFELPVVAFYGLDVSWQAYLFWTINIKPKRINASMAFDLYPLLRTEDWLEKFEGHAIYRETRAQELTEALWSYPESIWFHKINMLAERGQGNVTQAAWIRSLMATYVKRWEGNESLRIGGLFGAPVGSHNEVLPWNRAQQAGFLIYMGKCMYDAIHNCNLTWANALRSAQQQPLFDKQNDPAFNGDYTLLNTDQGVRGLLFVTNDCCYMFAKKLKLERWIIEGAYSANDQDAVKNALESLKEQPAATFLKEMSNKLAEYDWRSSSAPGLDNEEHLRKAAFRGSGGYKELRLDLLEHLKNRGGEVGEAATNVLRLLRK